MLNAMICITTKESFNLYCTVCVMNITNRSPRAFSVKSLKCLEKFIDKIFLLNPLIKFPIQLLMILSPQLEQPLP